jgi:hypothetical protein
MFSQKLAFLYYQISLLVEKNNEYSKYSSDEWIIDLRKYYGFKRNCNFFEECNIISGLYYLTFNWN